MASKTNSSLIYRALGVSLAASLIPVSQVVNAEQVFGFKPLQRGYRLANSCGLHHLTIPSKGYTAEDKAKACAEGKCGGCSSKPASQETGKAGKTEQPAATQNGASPSDPKPPSNKTVEGV